ncbi:MAG: RNA methyltransferase [Cyanobacteria bacterium]|nr:RNA methyltransferase [Cyanobacteriota bacterium]MDA1020342.1 RNA methyltransferase [Cyanobacteriota bacterium]
MVTEQRLTKITAVVSERQEGIVVLEDIHDPHNAQAVIRSCDCFGIQTIYIIFQNEKQFNPEKMGKLASSSANKWVDYKIFDSTQACFDQLKTDGYTSYATVLKAEAKSIYQSNFAKSEEKIAIVFGNEHAGLSQEAIELSDNLVTIPMNGMIQSLNLSVTAAIFLFEINRQRRVAGFDKFGLKEQEQLVEDMISR